MAKQFMTADEVIALLKKKQGDRTNLAFAAELGVTSTHLGEIYKGSRNIGHKVSAKLGLKAHTFYGKAS
jgi:hypothetical protein